MTLQPFRIGFDEAEIDDLHRRIDATRWPSIPFPTGWSAGTDDGTLRELVGYWRNEFDWFAVQDSLNRHTHLRGTVGESGEVLHCVVLGRDGGDRPPLLLLHGWPGSFIELLSAAELLSQDTGDAPGYEVVVPSLPGFGFSEAPRRPGMHPGRIAGRMHGLMGELGHSRYGVQGGDWGALIGARLAYRAPEAVLGLHLNFPVVFVPAPAGEPLSDQESAARERLAEWRRWEGAYGRIQGTKPQTLSYALCDSPVGQLAWILEKFHAWSEPGSLWDTFDRDQVLANVTLYWLTGTALSSARTYYESRRESPRFSPAARPPAPTGFARFPGEPWAAPRSVMERCFRLVRWSEMPRGGHFAAMEQPELFAAEVAAFFTGVDNGARHAGEADG